MPRWTRRALTFAAAFFVLNVLINFYRDGGVTSPALASAVLSTLLFTALYIVATLLIDRLRNREGLIAAIALRAAFFGGVTFTTLVAVDGIAAGDVTPGTLLRGITVAAVSAAVYAGVRALIAWVNT